MISLEKVRLYLYGRKMGHVSSFKSDKRKWHMITFYKRGKLYYPQFKNKHNMKSSWYVERPQDKMDMYQYFV